MAALTFSVLLLCSCSMDLHNFNYGYPGDPRPADEAILTTHAGAIVGKVDNHGCFIGAPGWDASRTNYVVRLLPGIHKVQVEPNTGPYEPSIFAKKRYISFEAFAGKHYDLKMDISDVKPGGLLGPDIKFKWNAKIVEVETGKEFHLDAP